MISGDQPHNSQQAVARQAPEQVVFTDYPTIREKVERALSEGVVRVLFTDIDATFVLGAGHSVAEIEKGQQDMRQLVSELNQRGVIIIPVTGSHFDSGTATTNSILNRIEQGILPLVGEVHQDRSYAVDAYVADGGAKAVSSLQGRSPVYDHVYMRSVTPAALDYAGLMSRTLALSAEINANRLSDAEQAMIGAYDIHASSDRISLQPGTANGTHEKSNKLALYFYASSLEERDSIEARFVALTKPLGLNVVCCEEKDATSAAKRHPEIGPLIGEQPVPLKYCLDIVPFDKGSAVSHFSGYISHVVAEAALARNAARPVVETWACGDSGNDFPLMAGASISHVVIVGGASQELVRLGDRLREQGKAVFIETDPGRLGPASIAAAFSASLDQ